ncbi:MAG TPA: YdcF family protein [Acetobacteraceae bacterium]
MRGILVNLLVPPFGLVTLLVAALLLPRRWRRWSRHLVWLATAGLIALAMPVVSDSMLVALEQGLPTDPPAGDPPAAIVVLGAEIVRAPGGQTKTHVGPLTLERLREAAELARRTHLPVLVTGGITQKDEPPVGALMAQSLEQDFQVPVRWTEAKSRDTWENASLSAAILRAQGIRSVYVVTHAWHMRRALIAFAHTGLTVTAAPTPLDHPVGPITGDFLPRVSSWQTAYYALHEWIGCAWYSIR